MKKITDIDVENKKVIVRVDYNVPIKDGVITDSNRIEASLRTINYLLDKNAKIILLSHLGKVKEKKDIEKNTLLPVKKVLENLLNKEVFFASSPKGEEFENFASNLKSREILLVENTRHLDYPNKLESNNDKELSKYWANFAEVFIMDAFASAHRAHASTVGIIEYLPSAAGFLLIEEREELDKIINIEKNLLLGGAKVSDKIGVIENLIGNTKHILIGGAMCATFLNANGLNVGKTFVDTEKIEYAKKLLETNKDKIILPIDVITENGVKNIQEITSEESIFDIGPKTIELFTSLLDKNTLVLTNGTMGLYEDSRYENGTKTLLTYLSNNAIKTIICGGDTGSAVKKYNLSFYYISTGGGASLEYLSGTSLPGITSLGG